MDGHEFLLAGEFEVQQSDGSFVLVGADDLVATVEAGPLLQVAVPDWAAPETQLAFQATSDTGDVVVTVVSKSHPGAKAASYKGSLPVTDVELVGAWSWASAPA